MKSKRAEWEQLITCSLIQNSGLMVLIRLMAASPWRRAARARGHGDRGVAGG
jgi:hypothetical protein